MYTYHPWNEQSQKPQFLVSWDQTSREVSSGGLGHCVWRQTWLHHCCECLGSWRHDCLHLSRSHTLRKQMCNSSASISACFTFWVWPGRKGKLPTSFPLWWPGLFVLLWKHLWHISSPLVTPLPRTSLQGCLTAVSDFLGGGEIQFPRNLEFGNDRFSFILHTWENQRLEKD